MAKPRKPGTTRTTRAKAAAKLKGGAPDGAKIEDAVVVDETVGSDGEASAAAKPESAAAAAPEAKVADKGAPTAAAAAAKADMPNAKAAMDDAKSAKPATAKTTEARATGKPADSKAAAADTVAGSETPKDTTERKTSIPAAAPQPVAIASAPPPRSGFMPLVLGGVVAAVLGAAALYFGDRQGWIDLGGTDTTALQSTIAAQSAEIATLRGALDTAKTDIVALRDTKPDLSAVTGAVEQVSTDLELAVASLSQRLDATDARLAEVAKQPIPEAELPAEVVAAYEAKFGELQTALEARMAAMQADQTSNLAAIETRLDTRLIDIETARGAAREAELAAMQAAEAAKARAALADIDAALDTGAGFGAALETLGTAIDAPVPAELARLAEAGAPTLTQLQASFADGARAALVASTRAAAEDGSVDRMTAFFRTQLGARSLEPREGNDPDAVLSRAAGSVGKGDLQAALAEIASLPPAGQAALADWTGRAETLLSARGALASVAAHLNSN